MSYYSPIIAILTTLFFIAAILSSKFSKKVQDIPNKRSLHSAPTPRTGGVGLMVGVLSGWTLMHATLTWWLVLPLILLFFISLLDDMRSLPVKQRLLVHLVAAGVMVAGSGIFAQYGAVASLVIFVLTVWVTNLYNFMDGSDGLAGGMAMVGFAFYGTAAVLAHDYAFAMLNYAISAASIGFLYFNFPPAKIFMGDAGSIPLGFLAAALGVWGWQHGHWAVWFPLLVFSPFIVDASVTLIKRAMRGVKITEAHCEHYYQRAIQMGWSHRAVALMEYSLMLCVGLSALAAMHYGSSWLIICAWGGIYGFLMWKIEVNWKRTRRGAHA